MKEQKGIKAVTMKVNVEMWERFCETATKREKSKSGLFSDMVYTDYCIDRQEVAKNMVNLMDCVNNLDGVCDSALFKVLVNQCVDIDLKRHQLIATDILHAMPVTIVPDCT